MTSALANYATKAEVSCELSVSTKEAMGLLYVPKCWLSEVSCELSVSTKEAMGMLSQLCAVSQHQRSHGATVARVNKLVRPITSALVRPFLLSLHRHSRCCAICLNWARDGGNCSFSGAGAICYCSNTGPVNFHPPPSPFTPNHTNQQQLTLTKELEDGSPRKEEGMMWPGVLGSLQFSTEELDILVGSSTTVQLRVLQELNDNSTILLDVNHKDLISIDPISIPILDGRGSIGKFWNITVISHDAGYAIITANISNSNSRAPLTTVQSPGLVKVCPSSNWLGPVSVAPFSQLRRQKRIWACAWSQCWCYWTVTRVCCCFDYSNTDTFLRVTSLHDNAIALISVIVGWIYFAAWSVSFYPQIYVNWRRKSVVGLNFDFLALNIVGFILYALFNCGLFWIPEVKEEYFNRYPRGLNPVQVNDIVFAVHASFATAITITQCFLYERANQTVSKIARSILALFASFLLISVIIAATEVITWLDFLYYCSYVKLAITLIKYVPQGWMNYQRKSTLGWSIGNIFLDFTGGMLSMLQMILNAYNYNDWDSIFGDPTKFGLGLFSVVFDIFFMVQHYILYR
uniref:Cystinosin n=1 Tax=Timema douglasi TaxID=61478 RepID=A0A7R8VE77_TIMDO|nr:unnamed protein product [Timema douglasi]